MAQNRTYNCDTIPEPQHLAIDRLRDSQQHTLSPIIQIDSHNSPSAFDVPTQEELLSTPPHSDRSSSSSSETAQPSWANPNVDGTTDRETNAPSRDRKLCVRHLRMADEGTYSRLQKSLDALPFLDRQTVNGIWSTFSSSSHARRTTILQGILTMCCFTQLSFLTEQLNLLIRLDPLTIFPKEVSLKVLGYLDAFSLCRAAQVSKTWSALADDDVLWRDICEQHIGHTCRKCGWGLPVMEKRKHLARLPSTPSLLSPALDDMRLSASPKRELEPSISQRPMKRQRSEIMTEAAVPEASTSSSNRLDLPKDDAADYTSRTTQPPTSVTRPWKSVYYERLTIERNWRRGRAKIRTLKGHTDGVMCMQFSENLAYPSYPVLITGSYDRTVRVWNLDSGDEVSVLRGHGRAVRALQFDSAKLITASMDRTLKVWNWRTGYCIRTLEGHTEGVVCLHFDSNVLASGSVDATVKIWNFRTGECFTLRGHSDWVNSLQLWDSQPGHSDVNDLSPAQPDIDPGKMLFSASDDGTIVLWDLCTRSIQRTFTGHVGQVQSIKLLQVDCEVDDGRDGSATPERSQSRERKRSSSPSSVPGFLVASAAISTEPSPLPVANPIHTPSTVSNDHISRGRPVLSESETSFMIDDMSDHNSQVQAPKKTESKPVLVSGSLDNTVKIWDIETGKETSTLFGHIEGIWSVAVSPLRIVSASHDRTIKVWSREEGKCTATLFGHCAPVTCLSLGDDKVVSGSDDGHIRIHDFSA